MPDDDDRSRSRQSPQASAECIGDNSTIRQHYERQPERLYEALRPLLQRLSGWKGDSRGPGE